MKITLTKPDGTKIEWEDSESKQSWAPDNYKYQPSCTCGPYWSITPPPPCPLHTYNFTVTSNP